MFSVYNIGTHRIENTACNHILYRCFRICCRGNAFIELLPRSEQHRHVTTCTDSKRNTPLYKESIDRCTVCTSVCIYILLLCILNTLWHDRHNLLYKASANRHIVCVRPGMYICTVHQMFCESKRHFMLHKTSIDRWDVWICVCMGMYIWLFCVVNTFRKGRWTLLRKTSTGRFIKPMSDCVNVFSHCTLNTSWTIKKIEGSRPLLIMQQCTCVSVFMCLNCVARSLGIREEYFSVHRIFWQKHCI